MQIAVMKTTLPISLPAVLLASLLAIQPCSTIAASPSPSELLEKGIYTEGPKKGRPYLKPRADPEAGKFWLEMCDFHKHFKNIFVAGVALPG